jgi:hypothetical protein
MRVVFKFLAVLRIALINNAGTKYTFYPTEQDCFLAKRTTRQEVRELVNLCETKSLRVAGVDTTASSTTFPHHEETSQLAWAKLPRLQYERTPDPFLSLRHYYVPLLCSDPNSPVQAGAARMAVVGEQSYGEAAQQRLNCDEDCFMMTRLQIQLLDDN